MTARKPNVVYVFGDQHRADAAGYAGNADVRTPHLDALARESLNLGSAVAGIPVCGPSRACLMTGQYPLTHGVFLNDVPLGGEGVSIAEAFDAAGYDTAYIGKWHLDGRGRSRFIPEERRRGFRFWEALECTHDYFHSDYYGDEPVKRRWEGYDAEAQTRSAQRYIRGHAGGDKPFMLMLSYGPPHDPYDTAPEWAKAMYDPGKLRLRPNVPEPAEERARRDLAGYYAHVTALDALVGDLLREIREAGVEDDTIFVYTSDHGDMLGSHGQQRKQKPWDESVRVPCLLRYPAAFGRTARDIDVPINTPDMMPTLLGLCGAAIPSSVEGIDYSPYLRGESSCPAEAALLMCISPFGEWHRLAGGREYRGIRTGRHTYVRDLNGPWLLYDNERDPYQRNNLCGNDAFAGIQIDLDMLLNEMLHERGDRFLPGEHYVRLWGHPVDEKGTVPYTN